MQVSPSSQLLTALAAFTEARRGDVSSDDARAPTRVADKTEDAATPQQTAQAGGQIGPDLATDQTRETRFAREAPAARQQRYQRPGQLIDIRV